jgi:hypothetical protein
MAPRLRSTVVRFDALPEPVLRILFLALPVDERARAACVCRSWRAFLADVSLWQVQRRSSACEAEAADARRTIGGHAAAHTAPARLASGAAAGCVRIAPACAQSARRGRRVRVRFALPRCGR